MTGAFRKYFALFSISFRDRMSSFADVLARSVFFAVIIYVFSQLWKTLAEGGTFLQGVQSKDLVWYLFITEAIVLSLPPLPEQVDKEIQTGEIAYQLIRPMHYVGSRAMGYLGDVMARFTVNACAGFLACTLLVGLPTHPFNLVMSLPLILGAFVIHLSISLSISMLGFWVEDTLPFFWIYSKAAFILGGLFMPIDYYPPWLQSLCRFFPLKDGVYSVGQVAIQFHALSRGRLIARQFIWASAGIALAMGLYRIGVSRLEARGG